MMRIQRTQTSLMTQISSFNSKVRYTKEGQGGVAAAEVKAFISIYIFNVNTITTIPIINTILNIFSISHVSSC